MLFIQKKFYLKEDKKENKYLSLKDYEIEFFMVYFEIDEEGKRERGSTLWWCIEEDVYGDTRESWNFFLRKRIKGKGKRAVQEVRQWTKN